MNMNYTHVLVTSPLSELAPHAQREFRDPGLRADIPNNYYGPINRMDNAMQSQNYFTFQQVVMS